GVLRNEEPTSASVGEDDESSRRHSFERNRLVVLILAGPVELGRLESVRKLVTDARPIAIVLAALNPAFSGVFHVHPAPRGWTSEIARSWSRRCAIGETRAR
ncbi:MAG: hypothetical protein QOJ32_1240, partial [Frankiaceae bacterium]|nr:hypothetical protein [Frankiaceae bacterium]